MAEYSENGERLPRIVASYAELASAQLPAGVNWSGAHGTALFIQLAWTAAGRPGLVPQGDWNTELVPDGESTRLIATMTKRV